MHDTRGHSYALACVCATWQHKTASKSVQNTRNRRALAWSCRSCLSLLLTEEEGLAGSRLPTSSEKATDSMLDTGKETCLACPAGARTASVPAAVSTLKTAASQRQRPKSRPHAMPWRRDRGEAPSNPRPTCRIFDFTARFLLFDARTRYMSYKSSS